MIALTCTSCQKKLSVEDKQAGKRVKCPGCGRVIAVPVKSPVLASPKAPVEQQQSRTQPPIGPRAPVSNKDQVTLPRPALPDATHPPNPTDVEHDSSLSDFLSPRQADDELGRLGKYRILKILGHGGMGVVYKAEDPKLERFVAIKAMLPTLAASASAGKRFLREAQAMAKVKHDHIVTVYQVDEERGIPFLAMEFLAGEPLDQRLQREAKMPIPEVLRIGREIAKGLAAAHATGLIHRDIKPANIWLEAPEHRVKILDFGLARAASQEAGLTQQGAIVGTPSYMAPEQASAGDIDHRCDLFSLGCVLYRLCTGQQPFKGKDTIATLLAVASETPTAPGLLNAGVPTGLSELVMKLLEKDPHNRPASAEEVVETLRRLERDTDDTVGIQARPLVPTKRRRLWILALAGGLLAAAALVVALWQAPQGTVRLDINDPDIQAAFDKNGPTVKGVDKHEVKLSVGEHTLHIKRGDLEFDTDKFMLKKGDTITLKVERFKDGKMQVVQGGKAIGGINVPPPHFALEFDGKSSHVSIPSFRYKGDHPLTLEAWAFLARPIADRSLEVLMGDPEGAGICMNSGPGRWQFFGWFGSSYVDASEKKPVPRQRLVHLAGVYDGKSELRFYVDGELQSRTPVKAKSYKASPMPFTLGANPDFGGRYSDRFLGRIHKVRLSKAARYDKDFTPAKRFEPDADTVALYQFEEGQGDVLNDSTGNGHHGKIVGAKWVKADGTAIAPPENRSARVE
jgi:serine/threonine protein kinase